MPNVPRATGAVPVVALRDGVVVANARLDDLQRAEVGVLLQGAVVQLQVAVVQVLQKKRRRIAQRAVVTPSMIERLLTVFPSDAQRGS